MDASAGGSGGFGNKKDNNNKKFTPDQKAKPKDHGTLSEESIKMEKTRMLEIATAAKEELLRLMSTNEPLWTMSLNNVVGFVLVPERYVNMFPKVINLASPDTREESSKDSQIVRIGGMQLVEMILDSEEWANLFPTMVSKAETVKVLDAGSSANRDGALQLMYEEVHVLSHLVPSREFFFLRYCRQVEDGVWVIVDVSLDSFEGRIPRSPAVKLPSGCMIRAMPNGSSMVTWVEHVVANDRGIQRTRPYQDLIHNNIAYGARMWLLALQRKCEKNVCSSVDYVPRYAADREIKSREGRKSVMNLSNLMVQRFCRVLNMSGIPIFARNAESTSNAIEVYVTNRKTTTPLPDGIVITAITSLWLPLPPQNVFHFLSDENRRQEWDVLLSEDPVREIAYISIGGTNAYNRVSFFQAFEKCQNNFFLLQESCIDPMGAYVVFNPISGKDIIMMTINEEGDSSTVPILPSGFMVSGDGRGVVEPSASGNARRSRGSLLTMAYQVPIFDPAMTKDMRVANMLSFKKLCISIIQKIKAVLNCSIEN